MALSCQGFTELIPLTQLRRPSPKLNERLDHPKLNLVEPDVSTSNGMAYLPEFRMSDAV